MIDRKQALKRAVAIAGGAANLARALRITVQAISQWKITPIRHVLRIEELTGVPRSVLRPDVYPVGDSPKSNGGQRPTLEQVR